MNLYQLYANPAELKWHSEANEKIPEVFASYDKFFDTSKKYTPEQIKAISKYPKYAYVYAKFILRHRWKEAEPYIMKDPKFAYVYASLIMKAPWPEAEPYIMKDPEYAYEYSRYVLQHRWPEAEPYIKNDKYWWKEYKKYFKIK